MNGFTKTTNTNKDFIMEDKTLIGPIYYDIVFTKKQKRKLLKKINISKDQLLPSVEETCTHTLYKDNQVFCIIEAYNPEDSPEYISLLVHECVHVYQEMLNWMVEKNPSCEFEAYSIQDIVLNCLRKMKQYLEKKIKRFDIIPNQSINVSQMNWIYSYKFSY